MCQIYRCSLAAGGSLDFSLWISPLLGEIASSLYFPETPLASHHHHHPSRPAKCVGTHVSACALHSHPPPSACCVIPTSTPTSCVCLNVHVHSHANLCRDAVGWPCTWPSASLSAPPPQSVPPSSCVCMDGVQLGMRVRYPCTCECI